MECELYKYKKIGEIYVVSIMNHVELVKALSAFCKDMGIKGGSITGIGAVNSATLRVFDPKTKQYVDKTFNEQMEVANLTGNVSILNGETYLHVHIVLGKEDYTALAGHLLDATLSGAGEFVVQDFGYPIQRYYDKEIGLNMYKL